MSAQTPMDRSPFFRWVLGLATVTFWSALSLHATVLPPGNPVQVEGVIEEGEDVSAIVANKSFLLVGADEKSAVQVLNPAEGGFKVGGLIQLLPNKEDEADIEGMAIGRSETAGETTVYAIGCHCANRKKLEDDKTVARNLERLGTVETEGSRAWVYRFTVGVQGALSRPVERSSLKDFFERNLLLQRFTTIPSKENGIDIEGLAFGADGKLYAGLRGPVLRGGVVPVVVFDFDFPLRATLRFVNLKGLGIRDMTAVHGGFLILAGPVGEGQPDFRIFFWNGVDALPGQGRLEIPVVMELGELTLPKPDAKPEGLAVLSEDDQKFDVFIVFDGLANGRPTRVTVNKPNALAMMALPAVVEEEPQGVGAVTNETREKTRPSEADEEGTTVARVANLTLDLFWQLASVQVEDPSLTSRLLVKSDDGKPSERLQLLKAKYETYLQQLAKVAHVQPLVLFLPHDADPAQWARERGISLIPWSPLAPPALLSGPQVDTLVLYYPSGSARAEPGQGNTVRFASVSSLKRLSLAQNMPADSAMLRRLYQIRPGEWKSAVMFEHTRCERPEPEMKLVTKLIYEGGSTDTLVTPLANQSWGPCTFASDPELRAATVRQPGRKESGKSVIIAASYFLSPEPSPLLARWVSVK